MCTFINKDWFVNATLVSKHCSQLTVFLIVKCRSFCLPREFTDVIVYIALSTNAKADANEALEGLHDNISELPTKHPDNFVVVAEDFNHTSLKTAAQVQAINGL